VLFYGKLEEDLAMGLIHLQRVLERKDIPLPKPKWVGENNWEILVPVSLIGTWDGDNRQDKEIIQSVVKRPCDYDEIDGKLSLLIGMEEAPIERNGNLWKVMDREIILKSFSKYITKDMIARLMESAKEILSVNYYSKEIKRGISQGLAIIGNRNFFDPNLNVKSYVEDQVRELLKGKDWKAFASLKYEFPLLAEAAPYAVLGVLEGVIPEPIRLLPYGSIDASFLLCSGVLDGLERLAWSDKYFSIVANILIKLAELYPKGANHDTIFTKSFKKVFCSWDPQINVSNTLAPRKLLSLSRCLDDKKELINTLVEKNNKDTLFYLLYSLLSVSMEVLSPSNRPDFLEITEPILVTPDELKEFRSFVFRKVLSMLGTNEIKWGLMIEEYINFMDDTRFGLFIDHFNKIDFSKTEEIFKIKIYQNLKNCLHRYNNPRYRDRFKLKAKRIQEMLSKISLDNSIDKYVYLFSNDNVGEKLRSIVKDIVKNKGVDGIVEFAKKVDNPNMVGFTLAYSELGNDEVKDILNAGEKLENPAQSMAVVFIAEIVEIKGVDILDEVYNPNWSDSYKRLILHVIKGSKSFWEWIEKKELSSLYWKNIESVYTSDNEEYKIALRKLDENKNYNAMLELVFWNRKNADSNDIAKAMLENTNRLYYFEELMSVLYSRGDIDDRIMFRIEMKYFELFDPASKLSPRTVIKCLQINPKIFVKIISLCFYDERLTKEQIEEKCKEAESKSIKEQNKSNMAVKLLSFFEKTFLFADVGEQEAKAWLRDVIPLLEESGHGKIGYLKICKMLANAPYDPEDSIWPVKYVREFIEESNSESLKNLERGLGTGKLNSIGVHFADPEDPGELYSSGADKFRSDAQKIRFQYPKTARVLDRIAEKYEWYARRMNDFKI